MSIKSEYPNVHWIWKGGISFVYEVAPRIVVKVPQSGESEQEQFQNELKIWNILLRHPPCPSIVQCFFSASNGIFLEYMRDGPLALRIQNNHITESGRYIVTKVKKLEPLNLRKEWMHDLTQAVAFLESLNLAHGDLRPENILLDRDRLKLSDFDCTAEMGTHFEACVAPYGRLLNANETHLGTKGTGGPLSSRTEQFALGSLFYFINYGFEVYGDRYLTEDYYEQGPAVTTLMQNMEFPLLDGDDQLINQIIDKCWHNKYATVAGLAQELKEKLPHSESPVREDPSIDSQVKHDDKGPDHCADVAQDCSLEGLDAKKAYCQDLTGRGLLDKLAYQEPEQIGFNLEWYRHSR